MSNAELYKSGEEHFRMLDNLMEGCQILDIGWRYLYINRTGEEHIRRPREELIGKKYDEVWPGIENTEVYRRLSQCFEDRLPKQLLTAFEFLDGTKGWFALDIRPVPEGVLILSIDNSERRQTEDALRESESKFRKIYEDGPFGMALVNSKFMFISANATFCHMLGYEEYELQRLTFRDITHPEYIENELPQIRKLIAGEIPVYKTEKRYIKKDGSVIWGSLTVTSNYNNEGQFLNNLAIIEDITGRKTTESALIKMTERLELAARASKIGIWDWDILSNTLIWDEQMCKLYGLQHNTFKGAYESWLSGVHPGDREYSDHMSRQAISGGDYDTEFRVIWPDDSVHWLKASGRVFYDDKGTPVRMVGVNYDVTESKRTQEEINILNNELENKVKERTSQLMEANKEMEAFSYSVSHDLRAPLRGINGFIRILMDEYAAKLDEEGKRICNVILENAQKMSRLIDELLIFSRLSRVDMQHSLISFKPLINSIYHEITDAPMRERIILHIGNICDAYGDPNMLRQVWANLLSNAIKYSSVRQKAHISITCKMESERCVYCIHDNGVGFDMIYVNKLFREFERLHSPRDFEGTGVGLAIVQRIVQRHGGNVWAEGEVDKGARFYFSLPPNTIMDSLSG